MELINKIFKGDKVIWIVYISLCIISIIEYYSASSVLAFASSNYWDPIVAHTKFIVTGFVLVVIFHKFDYKWLKVAGLLLYLFSLILLLYLFISSMMGQGLVNNAARWISIAGVTFQPSELGKISLVLITAFFMSFRTKDNQPNKNAIKVTYIASGVMIMFIVTENFSTAALCSIIVLTILFVARVNTKQLIRVVAVVLAIALAAMVVRTAYKNITQKEGVGAHRANTWSSRVKKHVMPFPENVDSLKFETDGQVIYSRIAIAQSNGIGKGIGKSTQRNYITHAFSDFIYAIILEETGILGGVIIIFLYFILLARGLKIVRNFDDPFGAYLVVGITVLITLQAVVNMSVAVGLIPVTGLPLPLISKGGTGILIYSFAFGILLSVSRVIEEKKEKERLAQEKLAMKQDAINATDNTMKSECTEYDNYSTETDEIEIKKEEYFDEEKSNTIEL